MKKKDLPGNCRSFYYKLQDTHPVPCNIDEMIDANLNPIRYDQINKKISVETTFNGCVLKNNHYFFRTIIHGGKLDGQTKYTNLYSLALLTHMEAKLIVYIYNEYMKMIKESLKYMLVYLLYYLAIFLLYIQKGDPASLTFLIASTAAFFGFSIYIFLNARKCKKHVNTARKKWQTPSFNSPTHEK